MRHSLFHKALIWQKVIYKCSPFTILVLVYPNLIKWYDRWTHVGQLTVTVWSSRRISFTSFCWSVLTVCLFLTWPVTCSAWKHGSISLVASTSSRDRYFPLSCKSRNICPTPWATTNPWSFHDSVPTNWAHDWHVVTSVEPSISYCFVKFTLQQWFSWFYALFLWFYEQFT